MLHGNGVDISNINSFLMPENIALAADTTNCMEDTQDFPSNSTHDLSTEYAKPKLSGSPIVTTTFSHIITPGGKTVAMSIYKPRLTVNGKRVGRPPGTFKICKTPRKLAIPENIFDVPKACKWDDCNELFTTVKAFVNHMFAEHYNSKELICRWNGCDLREFKSFYLLIGHCRTHTGERPNKCPECPKAYKSRENLTTHLRTHTGEKPYKCQFENCVKQFNNASDRGKHENRCHSNKKEYICDIDNCTKSYTDPSSLRKHVLHKHGPEAQEKRKKVKVRWFYRRDGRKLNPDGTVTPINKSIERIQDARISSSPEQAEPTSEVQSTSYKVPVVSNTIMDFSMSAFRTYIPNAIMHNLHMLQLMKMQQRHCILIQLLKRQEYVWQSYQELQKPIVIHPKDEYKPCECDECKFQNIQRTRIDTFN